MLVVPRPPYLDDAPPKNVLPPIQPFKKHVTSQAAPSDQDLTLGVVTVLRGCLSEVRLANTIRLPTKVFALVSGIQREKVNVS